jgi:hypothetical protein
MKTVIVIISKKKINIIYFKNLHVLFLEKKLQRANLRNLLESKIVDSPKLRKGLIDLISLNSSENDWKLLYRGTRDGFRSDQFHRRCDNHPHTLTIVKSTKSWIFGGYSSLSWDTSGDNRGDYKSFVFSLSNPHSKPVKLKICCVYERSIGIACDSRFGPTFGFESYGTTIQNPRNYYLHIANDSDRNMNSYTRMSKHEKFFKENPAGIDDYSTFFNGEIHFQVSEIEVYALLSH